jgi:hypothetical protein
MERNVHVGSVLKCWVYFDAPFVSVGKAPAAFVPLVGEADAAHVI